MKKKVYSVLLSIMLVIALLFSCCSTGFAQDNSGTDPEATLEEGLRYFKGEGVPQDYKIGSSKILEAANAGSVDAMLQVAYFCTYGMGSLFFDDYIEGRDPILALEWFNKVAEAGDVENAAYAMIDVGYDYLLGRNESVPENAVAAVMFFEKAEELGVYAANDTLGIFYIYGAIVERDPDKALELFVEAFQDGYEECGRNIEEYAYAYYAGTDADIDINFGTAFKYYEALTAFNNTRAMYNLGLLYIYGLGVSPDREKGIEWIQKAADMGDSVAEEMLSMYLT